MAISIDLCSKLIAAALAASAILGLLAARQHSQAGDAVALALLLGTAALSLVAWRLCRRRLLDPLAELSAATRALQAGAVQEPSIALQRGEFAELAGALAQLARTTQAQRSQAARQAQQIDALNAIQARLLQGKAWYRGIIEAAPDGILISDPRGRIRLANPQAERLFGYQPGELYGQPLASVLPAIDLDQPPCAQRRRGRRSDGCELTLEISLARLPAQPGSAAQLCLLLRDVEAKLQHEEQARAQAERALRSNADLLANMSHEIRTPMNSILGMTHLLLQSPLDAQQSECLQQIHNAGEHLMSLLDDVLDYSRLDTCKLVQEPFSPRELLDSLAERFAGRARNRGLRLSCSAAAQLPPRLLGDALRLGRILDKFVDNALKFTPQGTVEIGGRGQPAGSNAFALELYVRDSGIGLTAEQRAALFQGPYQADASTTRRYAGSGLGLAIARKLAELMGGTLGVESRYGRGSTFWLRVTLDNAPGTSLAPRSSADAELRGRRVLLAEDNEVNQRLVCKLLQRLDVSVEVAADGRQAVDKLRQRDYDLVLMDMQMPVLDGIDATREIRALGARGQLPIVAISASAMPEDRQRCLAAGMNDFLAKPIKVEDLYAQLSRWAGCATPAATDAPAASGPLPAVAGLDCAEGLQRAMGDRELYLDLLRRLAASEHNAAPAIRCALADRDPGTALRRAHTLKGLLGTVGAIPAMHCAAALEQALRQGAAPAQIEQAIAALETQLTPLLAALEGGLTISEEPAATAVAPEEVAQIRQQLTTYLAEDDAEALNCFNRHAAALRAAFPADYPRLAGALRAFEFAQALDVLRQLPSAQPIALAELQAR